ncbi:MAG: hypothetical protein HY574_06660 [candidate division NC10 bacterium]|nr:hypothetical protein [candidate division NC10 bacterium]
MSEKELSSKKSEEESKTQDAKPEVLLTLIEHGSRPAVILLIGLFLVTWLFTVREPLFDVLRKAQTLKLGSFEVQLRENADSANLGPQLRALEGLSDEQLQLFLVVGKQRAHITYKGEEVTDKNLKKLQEVGLLAEVRPEPEGGFWWRVSEKGITLHNIIRTLIFSSIRRSAAP